MRAGDWILLSVVAVSISAVAIDRAADGALGIWAQASLPGIGLALGEALGWIGWALAPLMLLPALAGLWGRAAGLPDALAKVLMGLIEAVESINTAIGDAARWFALGLVLITGVVVVQRYVFGISSTLLQESVISLHALLFLLSSAATLIADGHVRVDILYGRLSERGKAWTNLIGVYLALIPMGWIILTTAAPYVESAWRILERSRESDGLPLVFVLKTAIPVFAVMMIAQGFALAARASLILAGRAEPARPAAAAGEV